jgi:hypothetical protein
MLSGVEAAARNNKLKRAGHRLARRETEAGIRAHGRNIRMKRITTLPAIAFAALALAGPAPAGDPLPQNDCDSGTDAGNTLQTGLSVTPPVSCSAYIDYGSSDPTDVYRFRVDQDLRLLSVVITPSNLLSSVSPELRIVDPSGRFRSTPKIRTVCLSAPCSTGTYAKAFGYTLDRAGEWQLLIGGDFDTIGRSTFLRGSYGLRLAVGGGGDDCTEARRAGLGAPVPIDAPNQINSLPIMDTAEASCTGSLPFADVDTTDSYSTSLRGNEAVAFNVFAGGAGGDPCAGPLTIRRTGPFSIDSALVCSSSLGTATADGTAYFDLSAPWSSAAPGQDVGYRILAATSSRHAGDCFTGADAGGSPVAATAMPAMACVGDVGTNDAEDWYRVSAAVGDTLRFGRSPSTLPYEVYDPGGVSRGSPTSLSADKSGDWLVRVATDLPGLAHFEGGYGVLALRRPAP